MHQPHQITLSFLCAAFHHSSCAPVAVKKKGFQSRWMGSHCPLIKVGCLPTSTVSPQAGEGEARGGEEGAGQSPWALRTPLCLVPPGTQDAREIGTRVQQGQTGSSGTGRKEEEAHRPGFALAPPLSSCLVPHTSQTGGPSARKTKGPPRHDSSHRGKLPACSPYRMLQSAGPTTQYF